MKPESLLDQVTHKAAMHRCAYPAPERVWEQTASGGWASRAWLPGERARYEREVLGREPE